MENNKYIDILSFGELEINEKQYFSILNENEELLITREVINFLFWTSSNENWLDEYLKKENLKLKDNNGFINYKILTEFWLQKIGKSEEIELILENAEVISDVYDYIENYYGKFKFVFINSKRDYGMVLKDNYRTNEQANKIKALINKNNYIKNVIENFFKNNQKDINHIDKVNAEKIINQCS